VPYLKEEKGTVKMSSKRKSYTPEFKFKVVISTQHRKYRNGYFTSDRVILLHISYFILLGFVSDA